MNKPDYGIKEALPKLDDKTVKKLVIRLKDELKVEQCGLEYVTLEHLTEGGLLGSLAAEILLKYWKSKLFFFVLRNKLRFELLVIAYLLPIAE